MTTSRSEPRIIAAREPMRGSLEETSFGVKTTLLLMLLFIAITALSGCTSFGEPEGWSGGAIVEDTLYIGTQQGEIRALGLVTGETRWKFSLKGEKGGAIYGTPAIHGDTLYIGGYDGILYALSLEGDLQGQEPLDGPIVGSPVYIDGMVLVGSSDHNLYAFETVMKEDEGRKTVTFLEKWRFPTEDKVWSTPTVVDGIVYFGSFDKRLYAVALEDGVKRWDFLTGGAISASPLVLKGRVYVGSFDTVFYVIDAETGNEVQRFEDAESWFWSGAISTEEKDVIYAASLDGNLYALDADNIALRWKLATDGPIVAPPTIVSDMIAVASTDGKLHLATLRGLTEKDTCNVGEELRAPLAKQGNLLYFGARDHSIRALHVKPNGNPDEQWVHFTNKDDPLPRERAPSC